MGAAADAPDLAPYGRADGRRGATWDADDTHCGK